MIANETEESMKGSDFVSVSVDLFYCKCYCCGSYIDSPKWLKNKKATINPKSNDDKWFQYALTVA